MKRLFAPLLAAIAALCLVPAVQAQVTTVSATCLGGFIVSSTCTGAPAVNASIYWQPIVAARAGTTGGQILSTPVKATVTSGAFSTSLADALAADSNTCYAVTAIDNVSGMTLLGNGLSAAGNVIQGGPYGCIQPTGSTWSFDTFVPSSSPPAVFMFGSTSMLSDWTDAGVANLDCPVWVASTGKWTPSALPCVTAKVYAGGSAPSDTCSATVNAFAIEINATPTAYLCSNATGSYAWNTLGGGGSCCTGSSLSIGSGGASINSSLQLGTTSTTAMTFYDSNYGSSAGNAELTGNWPGLGFWGIGPPASNATNVIELGNVTSPLVGTWNATQAMSLLIGGAYENNNGVLLPAALTGYYGSGSGDVKVQIGDGTGATGHVAAYDTNGGLTNGDALAGAGAGITTGPVSGTTGSHIVTYIGTAGQTQDSGVLITAIPGGDISGAVASATSAAQINGGAVPASAAVLATNSSSQPTAATPHQVVAPMQCADTSASATTYTCTTVPSIGSLTKGDTFIFSNINQNNTAGTVTLNIDSIGAKTITKWQKSATTLAAADLEAQGAATLIYDGTNLELSTIGNAPSGGGLSGMTSGQVAIAGSPTTITGSEALAGAGAGIITGPVSGTTANDLVSENGTTGQVKDSGVLITAIPGGDISGAVASATSAVSFSGSLVGDVTGTQAATVVGKINGGAVPASAAVLATNSSSQPTAATPHQVVAPIQCADTSASATTYTCTTVPSIGSLTKGDTFIFSNINQNNTAGTVTLNIDSIGAKTISKWQNSVTTLAAADLEAQGAATLVYDGTDLELSTIGNAPSGGGNMSDTGGSSTAGLGVWTTGTTHAYSITQQNGYTLAAPTQVAPDTIMTLATTQTVTGAKTFNAAESFGSTINVTGLTTLSGGIAGVTSGSAACTGCVGEDVPSYIVSGSAVSLTTATAANVTSITLSAGDWIVDGSCTIFSGSSSSTTGGSLFEASLSTTTATQVADGTEIKFSTPTWSTITIPGETLSIPYKQINVSGSTPVYLVCQATFSAGTWKAYGKIEAWRGR